MKKIKSVFFGSPEISVFFLQKIKSLGFTFDLIITNPDNFIGRKKILTSSPVKIWAKNNKIKYYTPKIIDDSFLKKIKNYDLFFVFSYKHILPKKLLNIPKFGTINLHPSLLPKYRGPSPIMSAILNDEKKTGVSLILLDEKMDHGPIIAQQKILINEWEKNEILEKKFAESGAELFFKIFQDFLNKKIKIKKQNHKKANYCRKYKKEDMELSFLLNSRKNFLKYCAFSKPFFFNKEKKRIIVSNAEWKNNNFIIKKIIPEGKKEEVFKDKKIME